MNEPNFLDLPNRDIAYLDSENKQPYVLVRNRFIRSNLSPEAFVSQEGLPETALEIILKEKWLDLRDTLRSQYQDVYKTLGAFVADTSMKLEMELYELKVAQISDQIKVLKEHQAKWGDLFVRKTGTDEILIDHHGLPVTLSIPRGVYERSEMVLKYLTILDSIDNVHRRLKGQILELDATPETPSYMHLLESKKP